MHYFINIGSNLGPRALNISRAARAVEERFGYFEISHKVESEPWGFDSTNVFCNIGMMFISDQSPEEVLGILQEIEHRLDPRPHRNVDGSYRDRTVDIDIVAVDELQIDTDTLKVPHPHLAERRFFLEPMAELAPAWRHPATGLTCAEMLEELPEPNANKDL